MWPWDVLSVCCTDLINLTGMLFWKGWGLGREPKDRDGRAKKKSHLLRIASCQVWLLDCDWWPCKKGWSGGVAPLPVSRVKPWQSLLILWHPSQTTKLNFGCGFSLACAIPPICNAYQVLVKHIHLSPPSSTGSGSISPRLAILDVVGNILL